MTPRRLTAHMHDIDQKEARELINVYFDARSAHRRENTPMPVCKLRGSKYLEHFAGRLAPTPGDPSNTEQNRDLFADITLRRYPFSPGLGSILSMDLLSLYDPVTSWGKLVGRIDPDHEILNRYSTSPNSGSDSNSQPHLITLRRAGKTRRIPVLDLAGNLAT